MNPKYGQAVRYHGVSPLAAFGFPSAVGRPATVRLPVDRLYPQFVHRTAPRASGFPHEGQPEALDGGAGVGGAVAILGGGGGAETGAGGVPGTTRLPWQDGQLI